MSKKSGRLVQSKPDVSNILLSSPSLVRSVKSTAWAVKIASMLSNSLIRAVVMFLGKITLGCCVEAVMSCFVRTRLSAPCIFINP